MKKKHPPLLETHIKMYHLFIIQKILNNVESTDGIFIRKEVLIFCSRRSTLLVLMTAIVKQELMTSNTVQISFSNDANTSDNYYDKAIAI